MSLKDRIKRRVTAMDAAVRPWTQRSRPRAFAYEFLLFGLKQAWACLFGAAMPGLIIFTHLFWPSHKLGAWYLLVLLSFVLVTIVHPPQARRAKGSPPTRSPPKPRRPRHRAGAGISPRARRAMRRRVRPRTPQDAATENGAR